MIDAKLIREWAAQCGFLTATSRNSVSQWNAFAELAAAHGAEQERAEWEGLSEDHQASLRQVIELRAERDEYQRCADDMAAAHKVERDGLRKVAQMALEWFDWLNATTGPISPPHVAKDVQNALRKELSE